MNNIEGLQKLQPSYVPEKQIIQPKKSIEETTAEIWKLNDDMRDLDIERRMAKVSVRFNEKGGKAELEAVMEKRNQGIEKLKTLISLLTDLKKEKTNTPNNRLTKERIHELSKDNLLRMAKSEFVKLDKIEPINIDLKSTGSCLEIIEQMLNDHEGVCIGESHDGTVNSYLKTNFKELEQLKVKTLFLEGVYPELQEDLDAYLKNDSESILEQYILKLRQLSGFTFPEEKEKEDLELIRKAREANIRLVGIEPNAVSKCTEGTERALALHYAASQIINQEKGTGKYLVRMGAAHLTSLYDGVIPGISELCHVPRIEMYKNEEALKQFQEMFWGRHDTLRSPPNITFTLEPVEKIQPQSFKGD